MSAVADSGHLRSIFVAYAGHVDGGHGGVQVCTREYLEAITAAGIECELLKVRPDLSFKTRLIKKVFSSPYVIQPTALDRDLILSKIVEGQPDIVFLNQVSLATLATDIRRVTKRPTQIVLLSHGLESTDMLHLIELRHKLPLSGAFTPSPAFILGDTILQESRLRADVDVVLALSPFDVVLEGWMGARKAEWIPRSIVQSPLEWRPIDGRLGYLGTLDHAPNLQGLVAVLDHMPSNDTRGRVRVVGGPPENGRWLAERYAIVDYLGALDEAELAAEAATWHAFMHPIFLDARGCSTKLATALSWHLPVVTTPRGHRGYEWSNGRLATAEDPASFARLCETMRDVAVARGIRDDVVQVAQSSPSVVQNAELLLKHLGRRQLLSPAAP